MRAAGLAIVTVVAACGESPPPLPNPIPGLDPPSCDMRWDAYRITDVDWPSIGPDPNYLGLDLDDPPDGHRNNILGDFADALHFWHPTFDVGPAFDAHLAGDTAWLILHGTCDPRFQEERVRLVRGYDLGGAVVMLDGDVPAVSKPGDLPRRGVASVPIGVLTDGTGATGTGDWQLGLGFVAHVQHDGADLTGTIGFGLNLETDAALRPLSRYFSALVAADDSDAAARYDRNGDHALDLSETLAFVRSEIYPDLDFGECDLVSCYQPTHRDGHRDHASLGLDFRAVPVQVEPAP